MQYNTEFDHPNTIPMPQTTKYELVYQERLTKEGKKILKAVDRIDLYQKIQDAKEGVTLANLLEKYKLKINENNLTKIDEMIIDLTNLPNGLNETLNVINNAKLIFDATPTEIKNAFNNNFNEFLAGAQNGTLESLINKHKKTETPVIQQVEQPTIQPIIQQTQTITENNINQGGIPNA